MQKRGSLNFGKILKKFQKLKTRLPQEIATDTVKYFKSNFRAQGFDQGADKWEPRKGNKDPGRAILKKSGNLRDAIRVQGTPNFHRILIINSMPYAAIHNFGGVINHPGGDKKISFSRKGGKLRMSKTRTDKQRSAIVAVSKSQAKPYQIKIPQRKFMGDSDKLRKMHLNTISKRLKGIFIN